MRVLYVTNYQGAASVAQRRYNRNRALGPGRKVELLTSGLIERGHDVRVVSAGTVADMSMRFYPRIECREPACGSARVTYLPAVDIRRLNLVAGSYALASWLAAAPPCDAILLYNLEWYFAKPVFDHAERARVPVVVEYEDDATAVIGARLKRWHISRGAKAIALARERASGIVGVSPELVRQIGNENSAVIPGAVGDDLLRLERTDTGVKRPTRVVYAGGLCFEKGPDLLVAAAGMLGESFEFDIAGTGPELQSLRDSARLHGGRVRVHGELDRPALTELLARADIAVNAQRLTRSTVGTIFPFKVFDYVGAGLPIVTSMLGEVPPAVGPCLVPYEANTAEALANALRDAQRRLPELRRHVASARRWVNDEYSGDAAARKLESVLMRATARRLGESSRAS